MNSYHQQTQEKLHQASVHSEESQHYMPGVLKKIQFRNLHSFSVFRYSFAQLRHRRRRLHLSTLPCHHWRVQLDPLQELLFALMFLVLHQWDNALEQSANQLMIESEYCEIVFFWDIVMTATIELKKLNLPYTWNS